MKTMKNSVTTSVALLCLAFLSVVPRPVEASLISRPVAELVEQIAKKSGRAIPDKAFAEALEAAFRRYGDDALMAARKGGPDLAFTVGKHGGEVMELAARMPKAVPALARNADELLPLVRSHGDDILALEVKVPGGAARAARVFDEVSDISRLNRLPAAEAEQVIAYAARADSPATARMLLTAVEKNGRTLLERLSPGQIAATGLSAAMITAASAPVIGAARMPVDEIPGTIKDVLAPVSNGIGIAVAGLAFAVAARMFLFYRTKRRKIERKNCPVIDVTPEEDRPRS